MTDIQVGDRIYTKKSPYPKCEVKRVEKEFYYVSLGPKAEEHGAPYTQIPKDEAIKWEG
jgi:hypothetical protein